MTIPDREPPIGVWMELDFINERISLMTTYKGWDGEQHVWVAWVPTYVDSETTKFGAVQVPAYTTLEFRQPKPEWDATKVSEKNYMPFEIACEGIRNMTGLPDDVELKFTFLSTFKIEVERVDGEPLPDRSMNKTAVTMPYPVARPGVKTQIGSM